MLATRWQPFADMQSELNRLRTEMDRFFGQLTNGNPVSLAPAGYPAVNLWEDEESLFVEAELPGMNLDDLEIFVSKGQQLTIKGERTPPHNEKGTWHRSERGYGRFSRVIDLPSPVDADKVEAHFERGVLTVRLPKREEARPRRIEVKAS